MLHFLHCRKEHSKVWGLIRFLGQKVTSRNFSFIYPAEQTPSCTNETEGNLRLLSFKKCLRLFPSPPPHPLFCPHLVADHPRREASFSSLCVFSKVHVCLVTRTLKAIRNHHLQDEPPWTNSGETKEPIESYFSPGWPQVELFTLAFFLLVFFVWRKSKCLSELGRLGNHNKLEILPAPSSLLSPTCMSC